MCLSAGSDCYKGQVALMSDLGPTEAMRESFRERRDIILSMIEEIPGIRANHPDGAFYIFPDVSSYFGQTDGHTVIKDADDFCDYVMTSAYVCLLYTSPRPRDRTRTRIPSSA